MHIEEIDMVQKIAAKLADEIKHSSYSERMQRLNLPTSKHTWIRGDEIELYKMMHKMYDKSSALGLKLSNTLFTRGNYI